MNDLENNLLQKTAQFVNLALSEIKRMQKEALLQQATQKQQTAAYNSSLKKAASALYKNDFLFGQDEQIDFVKRAQSNPEYLATVIEQICKASDASVLGGPVKVSSTLKSHELSEDDPLRKDPIYKRAFNNFNSFFSEEHNQL